MACVFVTKVDTVATVVVGVKLASVDLDDSEVQGVLARFSGENDGRSPDKLPRDTLLLAPVRGNLVAQGLECLQPLLRHPQLLCRYLTLRGHVRVVHVLDRLNPFFGISDHELLALNLIVNGGELLIKTAGAEYDHFFTHLAVVVALVFLVVVLRENDVPGSDEVDVLVVATSTEVEAACSLGPGPIFGGDRDTEGRSVWVASSESRVGYGDRIKEPNSRLSQTRDSRISTWQSWMP